METYLSHDATSDRKVTRRSNRIESELAMTLKLFTDSRIVSMVFLIATVLSKSRHSLDRVRVDVAMANRALVHRGFLDRSESHHR